MNSNKTLEHLVEVARTKGAKAEQGTKFGIENTKLLIELLAETYAEFKLTKEKGDINGKFLGFLKAFGRFGDNLTEAAYLLSKAADIGREIADGDSQEREELLSHLHWSVAQELTKAGFDVQDDDPDKVLQFLALLVQFTG